jgi:hypothetical protein
MCMWMTAVSDVNSRVQGVVKVQFKTSRWDAQQCIIVATQLEHALYVLAQSAISAVPLGHPPSPPRPTFLSTWVAPVSQVSPHTSTSVVPQLRSPPPPSQSKTKKNLRSIATISSISISNPSSLTTQYLALHL